MVNGRDPPGELVGTVGRVVRSWATWILVLIVAAGVALAAAAGVLFDWVVVILAALFVVVLAVLFARAFAAGRDPPP